MDLLSSFIITPLKAIFELLYTFSYSQTHGYGSALIGLSVITSLLIYPLDKWANKYVNYEKKIQGILAPQIASINHRFKGKEKNNALARLYKRYAYSPLYSIRLSFNILIQLPLLFGAYCFLESYTELEKVSFLFFKDLSHADGLLFGLNLMPFVMTAINLSAAFLATGFSKKDRIQATVISLLFLVILYSASSALLIYWTCNNVISLIKVLFNRKRVKCLAFSEKMKLRYIGNALKDFNAQSWKTLILLSSIAPACLLWYMNIEFFGIEAICKSIFVLIVLSLLFILIFIPIKKFMISDLYKVIFTSVVLCFSIILFYGASKGIFQAGKKYLLLIGVVTLLIFIIGRIKLLNIVLVIQTTVVVLTGIINHSLSEYSSSKDIALNQIDTSFTLNSTPNIYYILCESMNSLDIAHNVYGLPQQEIDDFKDFMRQRNFNIPDDIYSNGFYTLQTMYYLSVMNAAPMKTVGNMDLSLFDRSVISGNYHNNLLKILKHNGYHVSHLLQGLNYYHQKGALVDYSDIYPVYKAELDPLTYLHGIIRKIYENYLFAKIYYQGNKKNQTITDPLEAISWYFKQDYQSPRFVFQRMDYTNHTPHDGSYTYKDAKEWIKSQWYLKAYRKQLESIKKETDIITKNDPDAVIIYLGDHGAGLYRAFPENKEELQIILSETNISEKEFINDRFKVFAAVRLPEKIKTIGGKFSSANVFSKIFNNIGSKDGARLPEADNESFFMRKKVIHDTKLISYE